MICNRNGYWMYRGFFLSPDDGGGAGGDAGAAGDATPGGAAAGAGDADNGAGAADGGQDNGGNDAKDADALNAEIARLKAEIAKQKSDKDKAMKEAGDLRKELRSKQTKDEIDAAEKAAAEEAQKQRIEELERQVAKTGAVKSVMGRLGLDEDTAGSLADALYGASDIDNALLLIQKTWQAKEKALRMEFGKITGPGAGADSNSPEAQAIRRAGDIGKASNAAKEKAQKALNAYIR